MAAVTTTGSPPIEAVRDILKEHENGLKLSEIADELDLDREEVRAALRQLSNRHLIISAPDFRYRLVQAE